MFRLRLPSPNRLTRRRFWREDISPDVRLELAVSLFDNMTPIVIMSASVAVVGALIAAKTEDFWLWPLLAVCLSAAVIRMAIVSLHRTTRRHHPVDERGIVAWERAYAGGSFAFAACLGVFAGRAVWVGSPTSNMLVVALLFGYGSGLVARVAVRPWICIPSLALATVPPILAFFACRTLSDSAVGAVLALFAGGSVESIFHTSRALTGQALARRHLAGIARHDALTGLANRLLLEESLERAFALQRQDGGAVALHVIDLDGFKGVNDRWGHPIGDMLLKAVAARLAGMLRPGDVAARLGGDEFVVLQPSVPQVGEAELLAWRIGRALQAPYSLNGREVRVGASVGVALAPDHAAGPETLLAAADAALYRAKARGRNRVVTAADPEVALAS